jgi:hypothetical protein
MIKQTMMIIFLSILSIQVNAEGLYLQQLNKTTLTPKQLESAQQKIEQHKDRVLHTELAISPFHKRAQPHASLEHSSCTGCHLSPPHTKNERTRTFMNMHTQFIACETCHFRPKNKTLTYQWEDVRDGLKIASNSKLFRQAEDAEEKSLKRARVVHSFYKITPFYQNESVVLRQKESFTQATEKIGKQGTKKEKVRRLALIHAPLEEKGPKCSECHDQQEAGLDLEILGANTYQRDKIYNHIIPQFFARYQDEDSRIRIISILK